MQFKYGDTVRITTGFYEGATGKVASLAGFYAEEQHYWVVLDNPLPPYSTSCDCAESILTPL